MKIITIGSFKGGTGKTTLAALLGTVLETSGHRTMVMELDSATRPLARYQATREFADLKSPHLIESTISGGTPDIFDWQQLIRKEVAYAETRGFEYLLIDTLSVWKPEVIAAHLQADIIITTVTESPIDLYQIMPTDGPNMQAAMPYLRLVELVRKHAEKEQRDDFQWHMCLNRRSHLKTRVGDLVREKLHAFSDAGSVNVLEGLVDRVAYRNMMANGVTPLDDVADEQIRRSTLAARTEARRLAWEAILKPVEVAPALA